MKSKKEKSNSVTPDKNVNTMIFYFHFTHIYLVRATPRHVYLNTNLVYPQELKKVFLAITAICCHLL